MYRVNPVCTLQQLILIRTSTETGFLEFDQENCDM